MKTSKQTATTTISSLVLRGLLPISFCLGITFAPTNGHALGFRVPNQDAEAIARGNAFTATADNPSAIYYNPAGITQLEGQNASIGFHNLSINSHYESPTGRDSKTKSAIISVPQVYYTYSPDESPVSLGLGIYVPYGLSLEWPEDTGFRTFAIRGELNYTTINPVVAYEICPNLSLAIGPTLNYATVGLKQGIVAPGDSFRFDGDDTDVGFNAGVHWKPFEKWSFGASYRSETEMNFEGDVETRSTIVPSGKRTGTAEMPFAQFAMAGVSFRPNKYWNIEADVDWTDWNSMNTVSFKNTPLGTVDFPLNWRSSFLYELGVTRSFDCGAFVSAGYFFSENSTSEKNFTPLVPDTDLHVGSIGFGYRGENWRWAVSGQLITGAARKVEGSQSTPTQTAVGQTADGEYQWFNHAVNFTVGYHF